MVNLYKQRNFGNKSPIDRRLNNCPECLSMSDSMHDKNKGLTHYFLHTARGEKDDVVRLIGDVEIAMSQSPAVTSEFSPEYRQKLAMGLSSQHGSGPTGLTDEQLFGSVPCNSSLERDEIASLTKGEINSLDSMAARVNPPSEPTPPAPAEPVQPTSSPLTPAVS